MPRADPKCPNYVVGELTRSWSQTLSEVTGGADGEYLKALGSCSQSQVREAIRASLRPKKKDHGNKETEGAPSPSP